MLVIPAAAPFLSIHFLCWCQRAAVLPSWYQLVHRSHQPRSQLSTWGGGSGAAGSGRVQGLPCGMPGRASPTAWPNGAMEDSTAHSPAGAQPAMPKPAGLQDGAGGWFYARPGSLIPKP